MLEPQIGAASLLANSMLQLVGRGGPYDGVVFSLEQPLMTIGRVAGSDVALEDPSISRRHAQLRLSATGDSFTVLDLRSSNGSFVDGQRVKRADCQSGSIVRFGDLAFKVTLHRRDVRRPRRRASRRQILIASLVIVALLVGAGITARALKPEPPPPKKVTPEERLRQLQADLQTLVDDGQRRMTLKEWDLAIGAFDRALERDPLNDQAKKLRKRSLDELSNKQIYEKGLELHGLGNRENLIRAKEQFLKIAASSVYHREARYKLATINERLAEGYRIEGVSRCKARYWRRCHAALCRFFELIPEGRTIPGEPGLRRRLRWVERRLKRRRGFTPCLAARFLTSSAEGTVEVDPRLLLAEKYQLKELQDLLKLYVEGRIERALKQLAKLRNNRRMRPHLAVLREVNRQLLIIRGKYQEGYSAFRERDAEQAKRHWSMVLSADSALLPARLESFHRREVTRALGDLYFQLGDDEFKVMHYLKAFELWSQGKLINPRHEQILNGLLQLEQVAERMLREGAALRAAGRAAEGLAKLRLAHDITGKNRPIHRQALKVLGR
jgi:tetratricopeptide (TPR) repeat protein